MRLRLIPLVAACGLAPFSAHATLGVFEHGSGIKALGAGGVSFVNAEDTGAIAANPASALELGSRYDLGIDLLMPDARARIAGNSLGPDKTYDSDAHHYYFIPQAGISFPIAPNWAAGITAYAAGIGPDYTQSPYARFASPAVASQSQSASLAVKISGLSLALAHSPWPGQTFGIAVNFQHETVDAKGLLPFAGLSQAPDEVSNVGKHGAFGGSLMAGWSGRLTPWLNAGASYRSKSYSQKIHQYAGLLPDSGELELPAIYGAALAFKPLPQLTIETEFSRQQYSSRHAFGNTIDVLAQGKPLGSSDGPGFGWGDQNAYKLGVVYQATPDLRLRAGYIYATASFPPSQTLFNLLAPATLRNHYTLGATWGFLPRYEVSGYAALAQQRQVSGHDSIPAAFGGGEASISNEMFLVGVSIGHRFGLTQ